MEQEGKTWLSSVVFLDIAGYTERSVTRQINAKGRLQKLIEETLADTPEGERVIIDTGDGAALCYLGDPERALLAAIELRDALVKPAADRGDAVRVRLGINLGPVRFVRSLTGQINPLGDGINNAQRVMSFAAPNQILVSRSFYEVIACLSQDYAQLFSYVGVQRDKHGKEHTLYELRMTGQPTEVLAQRVTTLIAERPRMEGQPLAAGWDADMLRQAREALAEFIGPVARVVVKKAAERARDTAELAQLLVDALPTPDQREQLLATLRGAWPALSAGASSSPHAGELRANGGAAPRGTTLDAEELKRAEARLATFLGPLARVLVRRTAQQTSDRARFYELLAAELESAEERKAFLEAAGD